jgi:predicted RNase H-like HicB family nuclease
MKPNKSQTKTRFSLVTCATITEPEQGCCELKARNFIPMLKLRGGNRMYRFSVIIEKADGNYSAYSPDLPGCIAVGDTIEETQHNMAEAMRLHLEGMLEDHEPIPVPQSSVQYIDITLPVSAA